MRFDQFIDCCQNLFFTGNPDAVEVIDVPVSNSHTPETITAIDDSCDDIVREASTEECSVKQNGHPGITDSIVNSTGRHFFVYFGSVEHKNLNSIKRNDKLSLFVLTL